MAPPNQLGKRMKGVQVTRPFIYGTTARPFDEKLNPKPVGVPDDHTHSWHVFVQGVDNTDISYWLRRVQFKLHESIPNHIRMVDGEPGKPFVIHETGWGEFEITMRLYYVAESGEKSQTLYHNLRLHPFGRTEEEREAMRAGSGEIKAWNYEEQVFNEPYEAFYEVLTTGARPKGQAPPSAGAGGKGKGKGKEKAAPPLPDPKSGVVWERTALLPNAPRPDQPFSREVEDFEIRKIEEAIRQAEAMKNELLGSMHDKEAQLAALKEENNAAKVGS